MAFQCTLAMWYSCHYIKRLVSALTIIAPNSCPTQQQKNKPTDNNNNTNRSDCTHGVHLSQFALCKPFRQSILPVPPRPLPLPIVKWLLCLAIFGHARCARLFTHALFRCGHCAEEEKTRHHLASDKNNNNAHSGAFATRTHTHTHTDVNSTDLASFKNVINLSHTYTLSLSVSISCAR